MCARLSERINFCIRNNTNNMYRALSSIRIRLTTHIRIIRCIMIILNSRTAVINDMRTRKRDRVGSRVVRCIGMCIGINGQVPS